MSIGSGRPVVRAEAFPIARHPAGLLVRARRIREAVISSAAAR